MLGPTARRGTSQPASRVDRLSECARRSRQQQQEAWSLCKVLSGLTLAMQGHRRSCCFDLAVGSGLRPPEGERSDMVVCIEKLQRPVGEDQFARGQRDQEASILCLLGGQGSRFDPSRIINSRKLAWLHLNNTLFRSTS